MSRKQNIKSKKGFTIIEVVLVLAVAGLIFLMVFIALPALQRSQRDTQRRNDYGMLSTAITSYSANNGGKIQNLTKADGGNGNLDPTNYVNSTGKDPNGHYYHVQASVCDSSADTCLTAAPTDESLSDDNTVLEYDWADGEEYYGSQVFVVVHADCEGVDEDTGLSIPQYNKSSRAFAIYGYLEGSGSYCTASQ